MYKHRTAEHDLRYIFSQVQVLLHTLIIRFRKEESVISSTGYIQVRAYTSYAQIPLKDVAVTVTDMNGSAIALRLTNRSGLLDIPIEIPVPERSAGQSPNTGIIPFSTVNLYAIREPFEQITVENLQIFPDTVTEQALEMIPLPEYPENRIITEIFDTPPQNL